MATATKAKAKVSGRNSCHLKESTAKAKAKALTAKGRSVKVVTSTTKTGKKVYCVKTKPKAK